MLFAVLTAEKDGGGSVSGTVRIVWEDLTLFAAAYAEVSGSMTKLQSGSSERRGTRMREGKQRRKTSLKVYVNWTQFKE